MTKLPRSSRCRRSIAHIAPAVLANQPPPASSAPRRWRNSHRKSESEVSANLHRTARSYPSGNESETYARESVLAPSLRSSSTI